MNNPKLTWDLKRIVFLATGPKALSWPVFLTGTTLSVVIHFAPNGGTVTGNFWVRLTMAVVGYLPALGFVALTHQISKRIQKDALRISLVFMSYLVGGALRGIFFSVVFFSLGMSQSLNLGFRIAGSAIPFGFATALATVAVSALSESRDSIKLLVSSQSQLLESLAELTRVRQRFENQVIIEVEATVEEEISRLRDRPEALILENLKNLLREFVRPLSHSLSSKIPDWHPVAPVEVKSYWRETLSTISLELAFRPLLLPLFATVTASPSFFFFFGMHRAPNMLLICYTSLTSLVLLFRQLSKLVREPMSLFYKALIITSSFALCGMATGALVDLYSQDALNPHFAFEAGITVVPTLGWIILLGSAANARSRELESELTETVKQLSWLRARINLVNWFDQGELSRLLHGKIQSILLSGIVRYESGAGLASRETIIEEMKSQIREAFTKQTEPIDLESQLQELAEFWSGTCTISNSFSNTAKQTLTMDEVARSILWDIISQGCTNAIRHGNATEISIEISSLEQKSVSVKIVNNGEPVKKETTPGLGTAILDACTTKWQLRVVAGLVTLRATLPTLE
jgi:hypothetical protein